MGKLFCNREGDDVPVQLRVSFCERPEERGDGLVEFLHRALGRRRCVAIVPGIAHTNAVTALVPEGPETQHALLTAGTIPFTRPALAELLDEALAHVAGTECFVAAQ